VISECVIVIGKDWLVAANDEVHLHGAPGYRAKTPSGKERLLSFRPTGEIFLKSLVARDDGPRPVTLATFPPLRECSLFDSLDPKFGQKILNTFRSFLSLGFSQSVETRD